MGAVITTDLTSSCSPRTTGSKHPQWYYNLKAHPECEFGGEGFSASRLYELAEGIYTGDGDCRVKTVPLGRKIPIFRLKPS